MGVLLHSNKWASQQLSVNFSLMKDFWHLHSRRKGVYIRPTQLSDMRRTNIFCLKFNGSGKTVEQLAENCGRLWNTINYKRRQSFLHGKIDLDSTMEYEAYKQLVGPDTAREIIRKNDKAWRDFVKLLTLKNEGKLPPHIRKVTPPSYWKE